MDSGGSCYWWNGALNKLYVRMGVPLLNPPLVYWQSVAEGVGQEVGGRGAEEGEQQEGL